MKRWQNFKTFKQRGEWVELQFMAQAASRGFSVLKPFGDSLQYDVVIDRAGRFLRVQVKGFSSRKGGEDMSAASAAVAPACVATAPKTSISSPSTFFPRTPGI